MTDTEKYKQLPNAEIHNCFGCSPNNSSGLQMKLYTDGKSIISWVIVPEHLCGWNNVVHGGVISTILDEIMGWAGMYLLKKIILTKSMTVDFIKPLYFGNELRVEGKVADADQKREATVEGFIYNNKEELCAKSIGTLSLFSPNIAKRLGIMDDEGIKSFFEPLVNFNFNKP